MLLVNSLDYLREDVLETFKNTFTVLGYKVTTEKSISIKKEWSGHRWCFSGKMRGNVTAASTCFQRDDLLLLPKNQRVSCFIGSYALKSADHEYRPILSADMSTKCQSVYQLSNGLYVDHHLGVDMSTDIGCLMTSMHVNQYKTYTRPTLG